jgi:hypothetical protein
MTAHRRQSLSVTASDRQSRSRPSELTRVCQSSPASARVYQTPSEPTSAGQYPSEPISACQSLLEPARAHQDPSQFVRAYGFSRVPPHRDPIPSLTLIRFPSDRVSAFRGPTVIRIRPSPAVYGFSRRRGRPSQSFLQSLATI